jgi:hypothetical protein
MSTIYEIEKLPESPDERPFIIAQNSKERGRHHSEKCFCLLSRGGARASEFSFQKCSLPAELRLVVAAGGNLMWLFDEVEKIC